MDRYNEALFYNVVIPIDAMDMGKIQHVLYDPNSRSGVDTLGPDTINCILVNFNLSIHVPRRIDEYERRRDNDGVLRELDNSFDVILYVKLQKLLGFWRNERNSKLYGINFLARVDVHNDNVYFNGRHVYFGVDPFQFSCLNTNNNTVKDSCYRLTTTFLKLRGDPLELYHVLDYWNQYYLNVPEPNRQFTTRYGTVIEDIDAFWKLMRSLNEPNAMVDKIKFGTMLKMKGLLSRLNATIRPHLAVLVENFPKINYRRTTNRLQAQALSIETSNTIYITVHFQILTNLLNIAIYMMNNFYADITTDQSLNWCSHSSGKKYQLRPKEMLPLIQEYLLFGNEFVLCFAPSLVPLRREVLAIFDIGHIDLEDFVLREDEYVPRLKATSLKIKLSDSMEYKSMYRLQTNAIGQLKRYMNLSYERGNVMDFKS